VDTFASFRDTFTERIRQLPHIPGPHGRVVPTFDDGSTRRAAEVTHPAPRREWPSHHPDAHDVVYLLCTSRIRFPAPASKTVVSRLSVDAPDRIRTCDLRFRRPTLYPTELLAQSAEITRRLLHAPFTRMPVRG